VLALIPVAAAIGMMVGRSSNNDDAKLVQALERRQAVVATNEPAAATVPSATAAPAPTRTADHTRRASRLRAAKSTPSTPGAAKVTSTTHYGSVQQIAGFKPTKAQEQQGAQVVQRIQKSAGKSYVNSQSNLPSTVVVP
jgi:hypothetical protein